MKLNEASVRTALQAIRHPEGKTGIVELGMVQHLRVTNTPPSIAFTLYPRANNDPFLRSMHKRSLKLLQHRWPEATLNITLDTSREAGGTTAQGETGAASSESTHGGVQHVKHIVGITSGKGGVGKSTITVNLAVTLARKGYKVGVLDADIFGPSLPLMLGVQNAKTEIEHIEGEDLLKPIEAHGVKMLSMGFFMEADTALLWRGPMSSNALKQLLESTLWGELDFLLLDFPPGTSDIHLTAVQHINLAGAIIVSTPQAVATADAIKAVRMFQNKEMHTPILGVVENMAWFEPAEFPGNKYYLFGKEGAMRMAAQEKLPFLGQIPLIQAVREGGDAGVPVASEESPLARYFDMLAEHVLEELEALTEKTAVID